MGDKRYAMLVDADNIDRKYIPLVLDELSKKGEVTVRRIYADWTNPCVSPWMEVLLEHSITPIQQYSYTTGKNSTDSAMIIDAMDILFEGRVNGFCLVSSDCDFTRLAARIRESGLEVIGMGMQMTPAPFVKACSEFKYVDLLLKESDDVKTPEHPTPTDSRAPIETSKDQIRESIITIIRENTEAGEWLAASLLGEMLVKKYPGFDSRNFGYRKLGQFLESLDLEVKRSADRRNKANPNASLVYVRLKK